MAGDSSGLLFTKRLNRGKWAQSKEQKQFFPVGKQPLIKQPTGRAKEAKLWPMQMMLKAPQRTLCPALGKLLLFQGIYIQDTTDIGKEEAFKM